MNANRHKTTWLSIYFLLTSSLLFANGYASNIWKKWEVSFALMVEKAMTDACREAVYAPPSTMLPPPGSISVRVAASSDDAEQSISTGAVTTNSTDLELADDGTATQLVGMRFNGIAIPAGAVITSAYLEFETDAAWATACSLTINGQAADNPTTFTTTANDLSARSKTTASVAWSPSAWNTLDEKQQTPSIVSIIQQIVNRPGWVSGNSMALFIAGTGTREAESWDGEVTAAPLLVVNYTTLSPEICNNGIDDDGDGLVDCADSDCSFITNNEFNNGLTDWYLWAETGNTAAQSVVNTSQLSGTNSAYTNISVVTGTDWHIQFMQEGKSIEAGKTYNLTFQAKATANRNISILIQRDESPWDTYWYQPLTLTTTGQTFSYDFEAIATNAGHVGLYFNLGESTADVWLDKISFSEICDLVETCDNDIDDDGDGLIDDADPDCHAYSPGGVTGAALWLKADAGVTSGATFTWADQSGNNRNAIQSVATNKPVLNASALNFNPALTFDGTNDYLSVQNLTGLPTGASQVEEFAVANNLNFNGNWQHIFSYGNNVGLQAFGLVKASTASNAAAMGYSQDAISSALEFNNGAVALANSKYNGTQLVVSSFGVQRATFTSAQNRGTSVGYVGVDPAVASTTHWNGNIPEIILFPTNITAAQALRVNSYLAIKYGITLDQTTAQNYVASNGTTIFWNGTANSSHKNNIAGIARDDISSLHQKQSKSSNAGLQVAIGNNNTIAADNASNLHEFSIDHSALLWGDNAGSVAAWTATGAPTGSQIVARTWKVQETGIVGSVKIQVADNSGATGLPNEGTNPVSLIVDADGNFTSGATFVPMTLNGTNWEANVDFTNGQFFTFGMGCTFSLASSQVNVTPCFGASNGAINLSPSGGIAPYTYNWSDIGTTGNLKDRTGLAAGSYNVSVTDAAACVAVASFVITQPTVINIAGAVANAVPAGASNGAVDLTVTNGTSPYAYSWSASNGGAIPSGQGSSQDLTGLVAGTYKVTVTDAGSCTATATFGVINAVIKQLYLSDPSQALDRVDPVATADNTTATTVGIVGPSIGPVPILFEAASSGQASQTNTISFSHTTSSNSNRLMLVGVSLERQDQNGGATTRTVSSVTYAGQSLTYVNALTNNDARVEIWRLVNPPSGAGTVLVTFNGALQGAVAGASTFSGVNQTTPLGTVATAAGNGNPSMTIAATSSDLVYDLVAMDDGKVLLGAGTGQSVRWSKQETGNNITGVSSTKTGATSTALSYSFSGGIDWAMMAVPIKAATGSVETTVLLTATDDAMLYSTNPTTNYGGDINFQVGAFSAGSQFLKSIIKFDVSSLSGQTINSAILKVEVRSSYNVPVPIEVHRLTKAWTESTVTWASPWTLAGGDYSSSIDGATSFTSAISLGQPTQTMSIDITNLVKAWANGTYPNYGLVLLDPGTSARSLNFYSSEGSLKPSLQVASTPSSSDPISATFTQNPVMCTPLTMPAGGAVSVTNYVAVSTGTLSANPNLTATLKYGNTTFMTLTNPTYNSGTGLLTWTGTLGSTVTVPAGEAISLTVSSQEPTVKFVIQYDSQTKPSKISLPVSTYIDILSYAVYDAPYPGGNIITNAVGGTYAYPRAVVTDPFGASDITGMTIAITPSGSTANLSTAAASGCTVTYGFSWLTPFSAGTFSLPATAKEGFENTVTDVQSLNFDLCSPTISTPVFALGATSSRCQGAGSVTYSATATSTTGITYSLDAASLAAGNSISSVTGAVTFAAGWGGTTTITATATGCGGPKTATHVVTVSATVGTPVFALGANSTRCQGASTVTYTASATNATGITYSLDAASLSAGNTINASTGAVTYTAGWTGNSVITATAAGCSGPKTATHSVTHNLTVTTPVFAIGATSSRCQGGGSVTYAATASNSTGITYSLDAASVAAGNVINASTGAVNFAAGWSGTSVITTNAAGCGGPKTATHTVTITPSGTLTFALGAASTRAYGGGTVTYSATANNGATVTYSLDATSLAAGNTINASTGAVTYTVGWVGTSTITASANGCAGTQTAVHNVQTNNVFKQLYLSDPSQALDRVDPVATADATTAVSTLLEYRSITGTHTSLDQFNSASYTNNNGTSSWAGNWVEVGETTSASAGTILVASGKLQFKTAAFAQSIYRQVNLSGATSATLTFDITSANLLESVDNFRVEISNNGGTSWTQLAQYDDGITSSVSFNITSYIASNTRIRFSGNVSASDEFYAVDNVQIQYTIPDISTITFTQNPALCSPLTIKAGQPITITNYLSSISGTMPASPDITAVLKYGTTNILTLGNPTYSGGLLTWTGMLIGDVTVPAGQAIALEITTAQPSVSFKIDYDSQTKPSKIDLPVSTFIDIVSYAVYNAAYPGGSIITSATTGTTVYPRAVVTDPFGFSDITAMNITISPSVGTVAATSVATAGCTRTYQYTWNTTALGGTYSLPATTKEGFENAVSDVQALSLDICSPAIGTPVFVLGASSTRCQGTGSVTYTATSTSSTGMSYSLDAASLAAGNLINATTGAVTFSAGWSGSSVITATAAGCGGPKSSSHTVTLTPTVGAPVFVLGTSSYRCQAAGTVTYTASATNATSISYSLDATSLGAGNTINSATGAVAYSAGWFGTSIVTASATGCNGPAIASHTVTIGNAVGTPVFVLGNSSTRCGTSGVFTATAPFSTGISYSLDAASLAAGNSINAATGQVTFTATWLSASTITATASGCSGPKTATHTVTISAACPPTAMDDAANGNGGAPLPINVLTNDTDVNNNINSASVAIVSLPTNGEAVLSGGQIVYLPNGTFEGVDQFTYRVCDLTSPTPLCDTATVIVTIDPTLNDACSEAVKGQIYYIPYPEDKARIALIASSAANILPMPSSNIRTIISLKIAYPGMTLVWDHWEDGYETNSNNPTQTTTQVWGDGNPYNGVAPGYSDDILPAGAGIVLDNTMPANPRVASNIFYDGRDKVIASGQISITQVLGEPTWLSVQAMKTNVTPVADFGKSFTIPMGQNFPSPDFRYTALFIRASENNTVVSIDKDNNNTFETNVTLNEGENYLVNGGVLIGATVASTKPVGVELHAAGVDNFSVRSIPIFPATWYSNIYYSPVPTTHSPDTCAVFLYNSLNRAIDINWSFGPSTNGVINLPANTVKRFALGISATNAYKFVNPTGESFTAIELVDSYAPGATGPGTVAPYDGIGFDWSFNLISEDRLTSFASLAWAPGSLDGSVNGNPVWVSPTENTTIYVKYDGDVLNNGSVSPCGLRYDVSYTLNALTYKKLLDTDNDQSGLAVYTCDGTKIAAVYGEDASISDPATPNWDVGTTIQPLCGTKLIFANDDYAFTLVGEPVTIPVLNNDAGFLAVIDPATLSTIGYLQPSNGSVSVSNGVMLYTPNPGFVGADTLEYGVCSTLGSTSSIVCDRAYVIVNISACPTPSGRNVISGQIFLDKNKDGVKNDGGTGFSPGKVYLYVDANCNAAINTGELIDSVNVDASGTYQFIRYPERIVADNFDGPNGTKTCANGSDGSAAWASNWVDAGDVSTGYCVSPVQSAANTDVEIIQDGAFGYALRLDDLNKSATRTLNLSGATYAFLTFSYRRASSFLASNESIAVQVSTNGSSFTTIYTISGNGSTDAGYTTVYNQNISAYASATTYIRFLTNANMDEGDLVFIDDISIRYLKYPQCYITKIEPSLIPTDYYLTTTGQHAMTANNAAACLTGYDFGIAKNSTSISGTLYNDANGLSDGLVNGTPFGSPSGATVYAYLVDAGGEARFKTTVNSSNGTYSFPQADINSTFTLRLSTANVPLFSTAPLSANLPSGWASAGEVYGTNNAAGTGVEAGAPNSAITVTAGTSAVTGVNVGLQQVNAGPDQVVCLNGSATLAAVTTPGTWSPHPINPGTAIIASPNSASSAISDFTVPGIYHFFWTNNGISDSASVTVNALPDANAGEDFGICPGTSATLTASGGGSYLWSNGLGAGATKTVTPASMTTYTVTVTNAAGCTATDQVTITIHPCPEICANGIDDDLDGFADCADLDDCGVSPFAGTDLTICLTDSTLLSASATGGPEPFTYLWDNGLGSGPDKTVSPLTTTTFVVTVTNGNGCTGSDSILVTVIPCTEVCADGIDNDFDGLVDCADPDCAATGQPQLADDTYNMCPNTVFVEQVVFNDVNLQNPVYSIFSNPTKGSAVIDQTGKFTYSPSISDCGSDAFSYQVCNSVTGCCDQALVSLNIGDNLPPSLVNVPADITIGCDDIVPIPPFVYGIDGCPGIYITLDETSTQVNAGACGNYSITRTWTATDLCGNSSAASQVITVVDNIAPEMFRVYTLPNGKKLVAGVVQKASQTWKQVRFPIAFSQPPLVFSQVVTEAEFSAVTVRQRNVTTQGFQMRLQEEEISSGAHANEQVAWMAMEQGALTGATALESGLLANLTNVAQQLDFAQVFPSGSPVFIASSQTFKDNEPCALRFSNKTGASINVFLEEEQSKDAEQTHGNENLAWLAMTPGADLVDQQGAFVGESANLTLTNAWTIVNLNHSFTKPVVLLGGLGAGGDPATIRVRNVTANSFQARIDEWEYLDGTHTAENASYLVIEGSISGAPENYCNGNSAAIQPGVNLFAIDNCDQQIEFGYTEAESFVTGGLRLQRDWTATDDCGNSMGVSRTDTCTVAAVRLKAMLFGAFLGNGGGTLMRDDLRKKGYMPTVEPYTGMLGYTHKGDGGGETISPSMLAVAGDDAIVDWLFVEIRDPADVANVLVTAAVLLQRDGDVVSNLGDSILFFPHLSEGDYLVAIRHRNHLGLVTADLFYLSSEDPPLVDFRDGDTPMWQNEQSGHFVDGVRMLWSGDLNNDRRAIYQGPNNDVFELFSFALLDADNTQFLANFIATGYLRQDLNMDGKAIYQGPGNDRTNILFHTVLSHPSNVALLANFIAKESLP